MGVAAKTGDKPWGAAGSITKDLRDGAFVEVPGVYNIALINRLELQDWVWKGSGCGKYKERRPNFATALMAADDRPGIAAVNWGNSKPRCQDFERGDRAGRERTVDNKTVSAGPDVGPINVMAQAGWDQSVYLVWEFKSKSWLCGSKKKKDWMHAPEAEAHEYPHRGKEGAGDRR